jgi:hypothetical protein
LTILSRRVEELELFFHRLILFNIKLNSSSK